MQSIVCDTFALCGARIKNFCEILSPVHASREQVVLSSNPREEPKQKRSPFGLLFVLSLEVKMTTRDSLPLYQNNIVVLNLIRIGDP